MRLALGGLFFLPQLPLQASQPLDLATLTKEAGPVLIGKWSGLDIDDEAPTPLTYPERKKRNRSSVYALDDTHGEWFRIAKILRLRG